MGYDPMHRPVERARRIARAFAVRDTGHILLAAIHGPCDVIRGSGAAQIVFCTAVKVACRRQMMSVARNWRSFPVTVDHGAGSARGRRSAAFLLSWVLLGAVGGQAFAGAQGATPTAGDLKQLSIEDLMNLDVTSVAKEPQRLLQAAAAIRSEEHTSELQSPCNLVCRLL